MGGLSTGAVGINPASPPGPLPGRSAKAVNF
jgi:hypothetical protein